MREREFFIDDEEYSSSRKLSNQEVKYHFAKFTLKLVLVIILVIVCYGFCYFASLWGGI